MADVINLRRARKAKARADAGAQAAANRAAHGRSKVAKAAERRAADRLVRTLDGAKREDGA
jgi:hypothetical protein